MTGLKEKIQKEVFKTLKSQLGAANVWSLPRMKSIVVNVGLGRAVTASAKPDDIVKKVSAELAAITGQKPMPTLAKQSIASFKTREGMIIGLKVTLHGEKMYDFFERFINIALPRTRDFRGVVESSVDGSGNLNVGIKDHTVFPESSADAAHTFGLEFSVVMDTPGRKESLAFFKALGFPFKKLEK